MADPKTTHPANPNAPRFAPDDWNKNAKKVTLPNGKEILIVNGANCYQYAFAGSAPDGSNNVYFEPSTPNPGETYALEGIRQSKTDHTPSGILNGVSADRIQFAGGRQDQVPPPIPGHYVVGIYLHEGEDYHFVRQDADGGWSSKEGISIPVTRYMEPNPDGSYKPLTPRFGEGDYTFVGYVYAPKEGRGLGPKVAIAKSLQEHPDGEELRTYFQRALTTHIENVRASLVQHYGPEIVARFDAARKKYEPIANPDAPIFDPGDWKAMGKFVHSNSLQYAFAGSNTQGWNNIYHERPPHPGETGGAIPTAKELLANDTNFLQLLATDGFQILGKHELPSPKPGHYAVGIYLNPGKNYLFLRQDKGGSWSTKEGDHDGVIKVLEPTANGGYQTLPQQLPGAAQYHLVGYTYAPKEGRNLGLSVAIAKELKAQPDGSTIKPLFENVDPEVIKEIGEALAKHYNPEIVNGFEQARLKYTPPKPQTPAPQSRRPG